MKWKKTVAVIGIWLLALGLLSIPITTYVSSKFFGWPLDLSHRPPDEYKPNISHVLQCLPSSSGQICSSVPDFTPRPWDCTVKAVGTEPKRVVNLNESFSLNLLVSLGTGKQCEDTVAISAPAFDVKPDAQTFKLPEEGGRDSQPFTFLLVPKQAGSQLLSINSHAGQNLLYYSVRPAEFLPAWLTPFISPFLSVLGPILTVPWWIERRQKKREEAAKKKAEEAKKQDDKTAIIIP